MTLRLNLMSAIGAALVLALTITPTTAQEEVNLCFGAFGMGQLQFGSASCDAGDGAYAFALGDSSYAGAAGDGSQATVVGDDSAAGVAGDGSSASVEGNHSAVAVAGDGSSFSVEGNHSAAAIAGDGTNFSGEGDHRATAGAAAVPGGPESSQFGDVGSDGSNTFAWAIVDEDSTDPTNPVTTATANAGIDANRNPSEVCVEVDNGQEETGNCP